MADPYVISIFYQAQTGNGESCSPLDNSFTPNADTIHNFPSHLRGTPPNQQFNGSNNSNDITSMNTYLGTKPEEFDKKPEYTIGIGSFNSSELQTVQNNGISSSQKKTSAAREEYAEMAKGQVRGSEQGFQVEHTRHQHHHYNHIAHQAAKDLRPDHDLSVKSSTKAAQQCISSNVRGPAETNAFDGNANESDHGSNGQEGSNTLTTKTINLENNHVIAASFEVEVGVVDRKNTMNAADEERTALREAALAKFRLKRKERCFEKKVTYILFHRP